MKICSYGCNQPAIITFKNKKSCCSEKLSSCPAMKSKNRTGVIKHIEKYDNPNNRWKNGHPRGSKNGTSLKGKKYEEIFGPEIAQKRKEHISKVHTNNRYWSKVSDERKLEISEQQRERILKRYEDGWMPKAGRCKKIKYESPIAGLISVDGTWELAVAKYLDKLKYNWRRNTKRFQYINLQGRISHYTPDFYVEELGGYLEVKGYETELDRCKWTQFKEKLTIWKKDIIFKIMEL